MREGRCGSSSIFHVKGVWNLFLSMLGARGLNSILDLLMSGPPLPF